MRVESHFQIEQSQLSALCEAVGAASSKILSKSILTKRLQDANVPIWTDDSPCPPGMWKKELKKADWLYNSFVDEINKSRSCLCVVRFLENTFSPVHYTNEQVQEDYRQALNSINKVLLLIGWCIGNDGKLRRAEQATTVDEVNRRVDSLNQELIRHGIDDRVKHYSRFDIENRDYGSAVLESVKGLMARVRELTGLTLDGRDLFEQAFAKQSPYLHINMGKTKSEQDEQRGVQEFFCSLLGLIRNPMSHTLKLDWHIDERQSIELLGLASVAHKYLDRCIPDPMKCHRKER